MAHFEELQTLWQTQPQQPLPPFDSRRFRQAQRRFGRITNWINAGKAILFLGTMAWLILSGPITALAVAGFALLIAGALIYMVLDWRNQILISRLDYSEPSIEFVRDALARIGNYRNPFRLGLWTPIVLVTVGYELQILGGYHVHPRTPMAWAAIQAFVLAFPFLMYYFGLKIREKRFQFECKEVAEQLTRLQRELQDGIA